MSTAITDDSILLTIGCTRSQWQERATRDKESFSSPKTSGKISSSSFKIGAVAQALDIRAFFGG